MLPDTTEAACRRILEPFHEQLWKIPAGGLACFRALPPNDQLILAGSKRAHRTTVWQYMMWEAEQLLADLPGVEPIREFETTTYQFAGRVLVRFKKLDSHGLSANYPTPRAQSFNGDDQFEMFEEMWSAPIRVDVGYVLDDTGLDAHRILVVRRRGAEIDWQYAINPPADGVLPLPLAPTMPVGPRIGTRITARGEGERQLRIVRDGGET